LKIDLGKIKSKAVFQQKLPNKTRSISILLDQIWTSVSSATAFNGGKILANNYMYISESASDVLIPGNMGASATGVGLITVSADDL